MATERFKRSALPTLKTGPSAPHNYETLKESTDAYEARKPRVITKALRSLSSSSLDSLSSTAPRRSGSIRRLTKTPSNSSSMLERLQRRASRDSPVPASPTEGSATPLEVPFHAMELLQYGHLKTDVSLLKARSEYLVLTDHCLVKFGSGEAARGVFPQLIQTDGGNASTLPITNVKSAVAELRFEIPLRSIVAVFNEEGASPRFGIELWWFSQQPRFSFCKAHLFFALPKERDDWLLSIQQACRARMRRTPRYSTIPENLKMRINHIVATTEPRHADEHLPSAIFPVAKRTVSMPSKQNAPEDTQHVMDGSSFYFVIGPCMCYFVEVLKADHATQPGELRVKTMSFGTVTLTRFKASVASYEQRFVMTFRSPFGRETRLDLASIHYRRIIEALTKIDRELKPMWPQQFQQMIFEIKGLPAPLQLTSGNDLGGIQKSLQAYCTAFNVHMPSWTIDWHVSRHPAFRLLPSQGAAYSTMQLMAVFRALRYNSFFKAISFRDVDLTALTSKVDHSDSVVYASLNGWKITEEHYDILAQASVLSREIHALMFASDSIRSIDMTNVLGLKDAHLHGSKMSMDRDMYRRSSSEILRPILLLAKQELLQCHSIAISGNPLARGDIDDLANIMVLDHAYIRKLEMSDCSLGDAGLAKLWAGMAGQAAYLELIDTSDNQGVVKPEVLRRTLSQLQRITRLNIAGNTRLEPDVCLFDEAALNRWTLKELDISGIALNDVTVDALASYLESTNSNSFQLLRMNSCGLTGTQIARIFRSLGQGRQITVHVNANRLDEGIDDLCHAIACGYGPWSLFMQMVEFNLESSYIKLLRALTVNKTIECLSLAGSATPDAASSAACQAVSQFFSNNVTVKFLDISGFDSKLDEGRLGREFSRALSGIRDNTRIEHLRVRSQMLNINIGDLAEAISGNKTLHTLDCEGNGFNLSNFRHLIRHLEDNKTIRNFSAFSDRELEQVMRRTEANAAPAPVPTNRRHSMMARFRTEKPQPTSDRQLAQQLMEEWDSALARLQQILERNQQFYRDLAGSDDDVSSHASSGANGHGFLSSFGGLALRDHESLRGKSSPGMQSPTKYPGRTSSGRSTSGSQLYSNGTLGRSPSSVSSEVALSPVSDEGSLVSALPTPSDGGSPTEKGFFTNDAILDDGNYIYQDGSRGLGDAAVIMKLSRRQWGESVSRIDEE